MCTRTVHFLLFFDFGIKVLRGFAMSAYVVILKCKKLISVKSRWVQNPIINEKSMVFHSPNDGELPNFVSTPLFYFTHEVAACYQSRVVQKFGKLHSCFHWFSYFNWNFRDLKMNFIDFIAFDMLIVS